MFGAFRISNILQGGLFWTTARPWKLNHSRKRNVRKRLKEVDAVVDTLIQSGVKLKALDEVAKMPRQHEMKPVEKYFVFSRKHKNYMKGVHLMPHFTKTPHPRGLPKIR